MKNLSWLYSYDWIQYVTVSTQNLSYMLALPSYEEFKLPGGNQVITASLLYLCRLPQATVGGLN